MDLSSLEPYRVQPSSNWHNAEALKKEAPEIEYRSDAEEAADQWALVPEDDSNGIGIKQSKKLYDPVEPSWFIPRDDPGRTYPSTTESAVACAMCPTRCGKSFSRAIFCAVPSTSCLTPRQ